MTDLKRMLLRVTAGVVIIAGIAGTSIAIAQGHGPMRMNGHPVGFEAVDLITPSEMNGMLNRIAIDSRGVILPMSLDQRAQYIVNARREASEPERHAEWDDIVIVQSGYGFVDM